ncbi:MAG: ATP-binding protein [Clostridia bacterium]|nr:ATP-binding protein [Clostridia bacterium]
MAKTLSMLRALEKKCSTEVDWRLLVADLIDEMEQVAMMYKDIFSLVPGSLLLLNADGKVEAVSSGMLEKHLGLAKKDVVGKNYWDLQYSSFSEAENVYIQNLIDQTFYLKANHSNIVLDSKGQNGREVKTQLTTKILKGRQRAMLGVLVHLETMNSSVGKKLQNVQEMNVVLNHMGTLAAGVVHEVKNPIQSISGIVQLLQLKYQDDDDIQRYSGMLNQEIVQANNLLTQFLSLTPNRKQEICVCNPNVVCRNVAMLLQGNVGMSRIELVEEYSEDMPNILIDPGKMKQVLVNFLVNAVDAIVENGQIKLRTYYDYALNEAHIQISDNGVGMDEETLAQLGKAFFTTKSTGTGMGLVISHQFINSMGGSINVKSELGYGTTFDIILHGLAGLAKDNNDRNIISPNKLTYPVAQLPSI